MKQKGRSLYCFKMCSSGLRRVTMLAMWLSKFFSCLPLFSYFLSSYLQLSHHLLSFICFPLTKSICLAFSFTVSNSFSVSYSFLIFPFFPSLFLIFSRLSLVFRYFSSACPLCSHYNFCLIFMQAHYSEYNMFFAPLFLLLCPLFRL